MMFRRIVGEIFLSWGIVKSEEVLCFSIEQPKITHFHCAGALALDCVVHYPYSGGVVDVDRDGRLWVSHFFKG
mgnify:CR=1 FL=1